MSDRKLQTPLAERQKRRVRRNCTKRVKSLIDSDRLEGGFSFLFHWLFVHLSTYLNSQSDWCHSPMNRCRFYMLSWPKKAADKVHWRLCSLSGTSRMWQVTGWWVRSTTPRWRWTSPGRMWGPDSWSWSWGWWPTNWDTRRADRTWTSWTVSVPEDVFIYLSIYLKEH